MDPAEDSVSVNDTAEPSLEDLLGQSCHLLYFLQENDQIFLWGLRGLYAQHAF